MARDGALEQRTQLIDNKWVPLICGAVSVSGAIAVVLAIAGPRILNNIFGN